MQVEVKNFSKVKMDADLAAIEAIEKSNLPKIEGSDETVHEGIYKRRKRRQVTQEHNAGLVDAAVAPLIAAGYPDAVGIVKGDRIIIHRNGRPVAEDL